MITNNNGVSIGNSVTPLTIGQADLRYEPLFGTSGWDIYATGGDLYIDNTTVDKDIIFRGNDGGVQTEAFRLLGASSSLKLSAGTAINEFSIDGTMSGNSDLAVPTEKAIVTYVGNEIGDIFSEVFQPMLEPTGFSAADSTLRGDISFSNVNRTLTIQPQAGKSYFNFYVYGTEYQKTVATEKQITNVSGIHIIYFDTTGNIQEAENPTRTQTIAIIKTMAVVSIIYWNAVMAEAIYVGEERHLNQMDGATHVYNHFKNGLAYVYGLGLNTFSADGTGAVVDVQFGVDEGAVEDEDLYKQISLIASTTGLPVYHMIGASPIWYRTINAGYSARTEDNTNATNIAYNQYTAGAWKLTAIADNQFCLYHVFATTEKDSPIISIMGQNTYNTIVSARSGAKTEIESLILNDILFPEVRALGTIIYQANSTYVNNINARIRKTAEGDNYVDWRNEVISRTALTTSDHNGLTNLQAAATGVTYGHINDAAQTIAGAKTFSTGIIVPDSIKMQFGTGLDGEISSISDDLTISNITADKDIVFKINDGGATKTPLTIDGSDNKVTLGASTTIQFQNDAADKILLYSTTYKIGIASGIIYYIVASSGSHRFQEGSNIICYIDNTGLRAQDTYKLQVGTGNDGQIYSSSDNVYIDNVTQDKDIIFRINDGGLQTEVFRLTGATSTLTVATTIQAAAYKSSDGSAGWTGTFTEHTGKTVTVKNGLITGVA